MMRQDIGKMRHRIIVYAITQVDDGNGGFERSDPSVPTEIATVRANVYPMSAREQTWGMKYQEVVTHKVLIRYNAAFLAGQQLSHDGKLLYIVSIVDTDQRKEFMTLMCREGGPM